MSASLITQSRIDEYRRLTGVAWADDVIRDYLIRRFDLPALALRQGRKLEFHVNNGSCQCGDYYATVQIAGGKVVKNGQYNRLYGMTSTVDCIVGLATDGPRGPGVYNATAKIKVLNAF